MRRLRFFWVLGFVWLPVMAWANPITVQSGEHANFTRIVAPVPSTTAWRVSQTERKVRLEIERLEDGYDTSRIFDLIPRDRIASVTQIDNMLELSLACDCRASAFTVPGPFVVIDVAAATEDLATPFIPIAEVDVATRTSGPTAPLSRTPLSEEEKQSLNALQRNISQELGAAATRGLLEPNTNFGPLPTQRRAQIDPDRLPAPTPAPSPVETPAAPLANIRISSSADLPALQSRLAEQLSTSDATCLADENIALQSWGDSSTFHQQIGAARRDVFGEFDTPNPHAVLKLARTYLHFGFGIEARQILELDGTSQGDLILRGMSEIFEYGHMTQPGTFSGMVGCEGDIALWALLASKTLDKKTSIDPGAALRTLNKLPIHLRQILAPLLATRLQEYGDMEGSKAALRTINRLPGPLPPEAKVLTARIALDDGDVDRATSNLSSVVAANSPNAPEALIKLVETRFSNGMPIDIETAELVASYARELEATELGARLTRARILTLIASGQFDLAFRLAGAAPRTLNALNGSSIETILLSSLTETAEDVVFLDHLLKPNALPISGLSRTTRKKMAERLLNLGFAENAQEVIATLPDRPRDMARQHLAARAAMALQQPFLAVAELVGLDDPASNLLRAKANDMAGAHQAAYADFKEQADGDQATRAAWLAEDWQSETLANNPLFGPIADLSLKRSPDNSDTDGMLARSSAALEESRAARAALADLLSAPIMQLGNQTP